MRSPRITPTRRVCCSGSCTCARPDFRTRDPASTRSRASRNGFQHLQRRCARGHRGRDCCSASWWPRRSFCAPTRQRDLPSGIGHSDLFPDNLLFAGRRTVRIQAVTRSGPLGQLAPLGWILDLEQAATIPYIYDVAVALLSFCAPTAGG